MKLAWAACILAQSALASTLVVAAGSAGVSQASGATSARLGADLDIVRGRVVLFERGWHHQRDYGSRLAAAYLVAPHIAVAAGAVITGPALTATPAIGVTVPFRTSLVFANYLTRPRATDIGFEHRIPLSDRWGIKISGDVLMLRTGAVGSADLHAGIYWRLH